MPTQITLSARLTFGYSPGWDSLDKWGEYIGAKVLAEKRHHKDDGYTTTRTIVCKHKDSKLIMAAIRSTFTRSNCRHEYDCCGCYTHRITRLHRVKRGEYSVTVCSSPNY